MTLTERSTVHLPRTVHWDDDGLHLFLDPEAPHWVATDARGAQLMQWMTDETPVGDLIARYAATHSLETAKAWLHVTDFTQALLRAEFARLEPIVHTPYLGRAAYATPTRLHELWFHTNNICNLACAHCLVSSAPWVQDWGLPTDQVKALVDEAVDLGVERFYFTGGEPFMRRDLATLIRYITEARQRELIILTNATLLKGERAEALETLSRDRVRFQVSVDGASPAMNDPIRGAGSFEAAVEGLRLLTALGFQTSVTTVVTDTNLQEVLGVTRLAQRLGVKTQHLMWVHRRGRLVGHEVVARDGSREPSAAPSVAREPSLNVPEATPLIELTRRVKALAAELGVTVDNLESVKQRANSRPGVKYDLGNACWDSLCLYSDGAVYPSAALANVKPLALGSLRNGRSLAEIWQSSPVAEAFRQASVVQKRHLADDPFRYLTGGGDLEHSFWYNANGEMAAAALVPERITALLTGPDPYEPLYRAMLLDAMWELARAKAAAVNRRSGYDAPRLLHAMGDGAIHCATDDLAIRSGAASSSRSHDLAVTGKVDVRTLHSNCVLAFDVDKPRKLVREFYGKAAETPQQELCCPTTFEASAISHIPKEVLDRFYGCGSPVTMAQVRPGETYLDLGSGAGIDCFIAAKLVGPTGKVIGVDMTDEMLAVAERNRPLVAANLGYDVVEFRKGFLESVPAESKSVDVVTSNCVINLSPDKPKVFAEIWRILKDHGRTVIADIVSDRPVPAHLKVNPQLWGECIVGALTEAEFLAQLQEAGFYGLSILKKSYWKTVEGYDFYSVTVQGSKFEKTAGCQFIGQRAIYLGPMKAVVDEEGHLFPRDVEVEVCTDTAAKLSKPPYAGSFTVLEHGGRSACGPGCC